MRLDARLLKFRCTLLKTREGGKWSVKLIFIPCDDTVYSGLSLNIFLVIYYKVHS
jgi:hypothetical protein